MKQIIAVLLLFITSSSIAQNTEVWIMLGATKSPNIQGVIASPELRYSLGGGTGILFETRLTEVSHIVYGAEVSSVNNSLAVYGSKHFSSASSLKVPLLGRFYFNPQQRTKLYGQLGASLVIQTGVIANSMIGGSNSYSITRNTKSGLFPLLKAGVGVHCETKKKRPLQFCLNANYGFSECESFRIETQSPPSVTEYSSTGSYFSLEFYWSLFRKI